MDNNNFAGRQTQLDLLRIAAIFAVVWLHVSADTLYGMYANAADARGWAANMADALSRWCVPVLVMLSGALLLQSRKDIDPRAFYRRRAGRILIPTIFWSAVYLIYRAIRHDDYTQMLRGVLEGKPYYHLWFLFMIAGLYAVTPFLNRLLMRARRRALVAATIAFFVLDIINWAVALPGPGNNNGTVFLLLWVPYTPYFLAGYFIMTSRARVPVSLCVILWLLLSAASVGEVFWVRSWTQLYGKIDLPYDYLSPTVILQSLLIFGCVAKRSFSFSGATAKHIKAVSDLTLGVYVTHVLWMLVFKHFHISGASWTPWVGIPVTTALVFSLSLATAAALRSIPLLRRTV